MQSDRIALPRPTEPLREVRFMFRHAMMRGVSAGALFVLCAVQALPAAAQTALPSIDVGAPRAAPLRARAPAPRAVPVAAPTRVAGPAPAAPPTAAQIWSPNLPDGRWAQVQKYNIPNAAGSSIQREEIDRRVNIVAAQDAARYLPSIDVSNVRAATQGRVQTRTFESVERNIVYIDNVPLNPLIGRGSTAPPMAACRRCSGSSRPRKSSASTFFSGPFSRNMTAVRWAAC